MKYSWIDHHLDTDQRKQFREVIVTAILQKTTDAAGLTPELIFQLYSHRGGLSGLNRWDFQNKSQFIAAKHAEEWGQFFTPPPLCQIIMEMLQVDETQKIADLTCGMGNWFNYHTEHLCFGVEFDIEAVTVAKHLYPQATIKHADLQTVHLEQGSVDIVVGNPPFNLKWEMTLAMAKELGDQDNLWKHPTTLSQVWYLLLAGKVLRPGGICAIIVPDSFMRDEEVSQKVIDYMNRLFSFVGWCDLWHVENSWSYATKLVVFQRQSKHIEQNPYTITKELSFDGMHLALSRCQRERREYRANLLLEAKRNHQRSIEDIEISHEAPAEEKRRLAKNRAMLRTPDNEQIAALLRQIELHPALRSHVATAQDRIQEYYTQTKPDYLSAKEWEEQKITPQQVIGQLKAWLRLQNPRLSQEDRWIYGNHTIRYNTSARNLCLIVNGEQSDMTAGFKQNDLPDVPADRGLSRMIRRRKRDYDRQIQDLDNVVATPEEQKFLDEWHVHDPKDGDLYLNDLQKSDVLTYMHKLKGFIQWDAGGGKTLALLAWNDWRRQHDPRYRYTVIVSSATAIRMMWKHVLRIYGRKIRLIRYESDVEKIRSGETILVTFEAIRRTMPKYKKGRLRLPLFRSMRAWVKRQGYQRIVLLVDESHNISNPKSQQTKNTLAIFRKVRTKMLATATAMLNTVPEMYPQCELLFNNTPEMTCWCSISYYVPTKGGKDDDLDLVVPESNPMYGRPYPAGPEGYELFKACHSPHHFSVFGIHTLTQDLYNTEALVKWTRQFVRTRTFEELRGDSMLTIKVYFVPMCPEERALNLKIMKELQTMLSYFPTAKYESSRKRAGLALIRQMQLLIRAASVPHLFKEWGSHRLPTKFMAIKAFLAEHPQEQILFGVTSHDALNEYRTWINTWFPFRPLYIASGKVTHEKRKRVCDEFQGSVNGILLTTQQALQESINLPEVNLGLVESLLWNDPKMLQFIGRIRRYNSTQRTHFHYFLGQGSIEANRMALICAKKRLTDVVKNQGILSESSVYQNYGLTPMLLSECMSKIEEEDSEGNVRVKLSFGDWGDQHIEF